MGPKLDRGYGSTQTDSTNLDLPQSLKCLLGCQYRAVTAVPAQIASPGHGTVVRRMEHMLVRIYMEKEAVFL